MKDPFSRQPIMMVLQQKAMYDAIFGVMQGTYSPKDALKNMDSAAAN